MKRTTLLVTLVGMLLLAVGAGVAWAQNEIRCTAETQPCMGTEQQDLMIGGSWSDTIYGLEANDDLAGRANNDTIYGGQGSDALWGSFGDDTMRGGPGQDEFRDTTGNDVDLVYGGDGGDGVGVKDGDDLDTVNCGPGTRDFVRADIGDTIHRNCENVSRG